MMEGKEHWKTFFGKDYVKFSETILTQDRTRFEFQQLQRILNLPKGAKILDLGCGQGRLSLPLAKAGYTITGFDGSLSLLNEAKDRAKKECLKINFEHGDMRELNYTNQFDAVINIGTAFGYVTKEEDDLNILKRVNNALKPNGILLLETENREMKLKNTMGKIWNEMNGQPVWSDRSFNCITGRWTETIQWLNGNKLEKKILDLRLYSATELQKMLKDVKFNVLKVLGGFDLSPLETTSQRLLILSQKEH
ncbi:class I SAM-dependent methyltransferase [Cytobacillus oceanisediminis]|uniref:class I SAM-dependent methyltransferase n=1 Tax=Cytobacillus oceanisediminis TaxID=665099 RepID=UPI0020B44D26|nr:class I SAM-dependent methyltransferase [Cytobacillus oceanisediminis]